MLDVFKVLDYGLETLRDLEIPYFVGEGMSLTGIDLEKFSKRIPPYLGLGLSIEDEKELFISSNFKAIYISYTDNKITLYSGHLEHSMLTKICTFYNRSFDEEGFPVYPNYQPYFMQRNGQGVILHLERDPTELGTKRTPRKHQREIHAANPLIGGKILRMELLELRR